MRVLVITADGRRCGHRLIWPVRALAAQGAEVDVIVTRGDRSGSDDAGEAWRAWPDVDVVVLQRPLRRRLLQSVERYQSVGVTVVVDIDDDFTALSPRNVVWPGVQPSLSPDTNWHILTEACRRADLVTVSTGALARRYGHGHAVVVPNHVPASYLDVARELHEGVWVGWTGAVETHPDDLQVTRGGVARAVGATGAKFVVVGPGRLVGANLGLFEEPTVRGFVPLDRYPHEMAQFDVGIVPLEQSAFNEAKSNLKGMEFAALGVPFVASPTSEYRALTAHVGLLASRPREWERALRRLISDSDARAELAGRGREWAATQTIEGNCGQWWDAWTTARTRSGRRTLTGVTT